MSNKQMLDLYVKAIDLAKEKEGLSNQERMLLNRFKILLRSGAVDDANNDIMQMGKVKRETLHHIRELAESFFEDWIRNSIIDDTERERILDEGKRRADVAEKMLVKELLMHGMILNN